MAVFGIDIAGVVSTIFQYAVIIIGAGIVAGIILLIREYYFSYNGNIRIKKLVSGGRKLIKDDKFKEITDSDGVKWYSLRGGKLFGKREKIPVAPADCIELNGSGQACLTAYRTSDGEYRYGADNTDTSFAGGEKPFPTSQRALLVNQIRKAEEEKGFSILTHLPLLAGIAMVLIVFLMAFIFWDDVTKPSITFSENFVKLSEQMNGIAQAQRDTALRIQSIVMDNESAVRIPQQAPG
jgi:hypothetical protein